MIVLHVVPYFAPAWAFGGVCRAVTELARAQASAATTPVVLTTDALTRRSRLPAGEERFDGIRVIRVPNHSMTARARFNLSTPAGFSKMLRAVLDETAIDVIHCHELRTVETLHATRLSRRDGPAIVVSPHGTLPYATGRGGAKRLWDRLFASSMLPAIDYVVALTEAEAADVRALWARYRVPLNRAQMAVVPNGVDPGGFTARPERAAARARWNLGDGPVVLFLGRLAERKGVAMLVDAFADVARALPRARLLVAGPDEGAEPALRAAIQAKRLSEHVVVAGLLSGDDRLAAFAAADVFALPAVGEGFSMAALEALACGVPVVLTPDCHFAAVAEEGAGLVVNRTCEEWATALTGLLHDAGRVGRMSRRARDFACRHFTWTRIVARMDAAYGAAIQWRDARRP
jgi:glycosyltransferase involved in cell wall biosynthesis